MHDESIIDIFIRDSKVPSDAERLEQSMGKIISKLLVFIMTIIILINVFLLNFKYLLVAECGNCSIIYPNTTKDFEKTPLEVKQIKLQLFITNEKQICSF